MECIVQPVGEMQANAYIVYQPGTGDAVVIDPGAEPDLIHIALDGRRAAAIMLTHGHVDHIGAVAALRGPQTPVYIHKKDAQMLTNPNLSLAAMVGAMGNQGDADAMLEEGPLMLAGLPFEVLHTPGHTPGSVCLRIGDTLFTGDTLFRAGVGRTDFPGGDDAALARSIDRLMRLDADTRVYPGHGRATTIGDERRYYQ